MADTNNLETNVTPVEETLDTNKSDIVSLETADSKNVAFIKALIESIKKMLKELMDRFSGKATVYEAIKKVEKQVDKLAEACEENSEVALQTVEALHELTSKLSGKLNEFESGNLTEEQVSKDIEELINEYQNRTKSLALETKVKNKDELYEMFNALDSENIHLCYNKDENVFVISDNNKSYLLSFGKAKETEEFVIKSFEIETELESLEKEGYHDIGKLNSENALTDMLAKMIDTADVPEAKKILNKFESEKEKKVAKLEELKSIKEYINSAKVIKTSAEHNLTTFIEDGKFKAFSPDTHKMIVIDKSQKKVSAQLYALDENFELTDENLKNYPLENTKRICECFSAVEDNGQLLTRFKVDSDNTVRRIFENEETIKYLDVICGISNKDTEKLLGIFSDNEFKPIKVNSEQSENLQNIASKMREKIGAEYSINFIDRESGTYIKAMPKDEAKSDRSTYITFKENGNVDSLFARTDDEKLKLVIKNNTVIRNAHAKEKTFSDVKNAFDYASKTLNQSKEAPKKQVGRE